MHCYLQVKGQARIPTVLHTHIRISYLDALSTISCDSALWLVRSSTEKPLDFRPSKISANMFPGSMLGSCLVSPKQNAC